MRAGAKCLYPPPSHPARSLVFSHQVRVSEIVPGSAADADGSVVHGDILLSVNGKNVQGRTKQEVSLALAK